MQKNNLTFFKTIFNNLKTEINELLLHKWLYKLCKMYIKLPCIIISTVLAGKLTTEHPYNESYLFPFPNPRFGCLQSRKGINNPVIPISLLGLCSYIHLFPNISYSWFYICTACFTQTSQLPHWLVPELEMRPANQSAARRKYINNCKIYFAPAQGTFTEPDCCGPCYNFYRIRWPFMAF